MASAHSTDCEDEAKDEEIQSYQINPQSMGLVIIINIYKFHNSNLNRDEGKRDSQTLQDLFLKIGYNEGDIHKYKNITSGDAVQKLQYVKTQLIKLEHSTFILCIMSHGEKNNNVVFSDGKKLHLWKIILRAFCNEDCLASSKPKLVITNFCRGNKYLQTVVADEGPEEPEEPESLPEWKHLLLLQASPPDHKALRGKDGSIFIQTFCDICERYYTSDSVENIMKRVITEFSPEEYEAETSDGRYKIIKNQPGIGWNSLHNKLYLSEEAIENKIRRMKIRKMKSMLENLTNEVGDSDDLLTHFCKNGNLKNTELLLLLGAEVNKEYNDRTPLQMASENGHSEVVNLLIQYGAEANEAHEDCFTALHRASQENHVKVVNILLRNGAQVNQADKDGDTPLHIASHGGHADVVDILLRNGAHVNQTNEDGDTPLYIASRKRHANVVNILLQNGAQVNKTDKEGGDTPLHKASRKGHADVVDILLQNGAQVNKTDKEGGDAPLHMASRKGHADVVNVLIEHGADVNIKNKHGFTPLRLTKKNTVVDILISHGAE